MARSDYRRRDDEPRRSSGGLSLSTGRLEGRPRSSSDGSRYRHNPLQDAERSSSRHGSSSSRRGDASRASSRQASRTRGTSYRDRPEATSNSRREGGSSIKDTLGAALGAAGALTSGFAKQTRHGGSFRRGIDWQTALLGGVAALLALIILMAVLHIGPFAAAPGSSIDAERHVGAQSLIAVNNNGMAIAQNVATQVSLARPVEPDLAKMPAHQVTRQDLTSLSGQAEPYAFALNVTDDSDAAKMPVLSDQSLVSLSNALAYYKTNDYDVSYLLVDLGTGRGIAGNLDASIYGASSFKGPYCAYLAEDELNKNVNKIKSGRRTQIENTITWSDNSSYSKLRRTFGTDGMEEWLADAGVDTSLVDDTYFPHYSGRQSALMWLKIYEYLTDNESSTAQWLSDLFASTEVSFLRNGALGTTSAGDTDYLPAEDSGEEEALEEEEADEGLLGTDEADGEEATEETEDSSSEGEAASESSANDSDDESSEKAESPEGGAIAVVIAEVAEKAGQTDDVENAKADSAEDGQEVTASDEEADGGQEAETSDEGTSEDDALKTVASIGTNITVRNKAGWINGKEDDAICDSGIVTINGRDYLMVIMTGAPDSAAGEQAFAHLARTLFEIRGDLV